MFYECEPLERLPIHPPVAHLKQRPPDSYVPRCHWRGTWRLFLLIWCAFQTENFTMPTLICNGDSAFFPLFSPLEAKQSVKWVTSLFSCKDSYKLSARYVLFSPSVWPSCSRMQRLYFSLSILRLVGSPVLYVYCLLEYRWLPNKQINDSVPVEVMGNILNQYPKDFRQLSQPRLIFRSLVYRAFVLFVEKR